MVQEPVQGRGGDGFGHEFVESGRAQVRADRDGPLIAGGLSVSSAQHLGRAPAFGLGGGDHLAGVAADARQPQAPQDGAKVGGQRGAGRNAERRAPVVVVVIGLLPQYQWPPGTARRGRPIRRCPGSATGPHPRTAWPLVVRLSGTTCSNWSSGQRE